MPFSLPDPPAAGLELVRDHVSVILSAIGLSDEEQGQLEIAEPYPVYTFGIDAVMANRPLRDARLTAWEYLIVDGDSAVGLAELSTVDRDGSQKLGFATLHPRAFADAVASTIAKAEELPEVATRAYELRILRAPSLTMMAIWLRGNTDLLLAVERNDSDQPALPANSELWKDSNRIRDEATLARRLRPLAEQRLKASTH